MILNAAVLYACIDLQEESAASGPTSSQRSRVRGVETALQEIRTASSSEVQWSAPSPLVADEISRAEAVGPSVEKQRKRSARNSLATRCPTGGQQGRRRGTVLARRHPSFFEQDRRVWCLETRAPQTCCCRAEEKATSQRNRRSVSAARNLATARVCTGTSQL